MTQTTKSRFDDVVDERGRDPEAADRRLGNFLRYGSIALVVVLVAFGLFYFIDQRTPKAPSIVTQAIAAAENAVRENPNDVVSRIRLATMYSEAGRTDEAIAQYNEIIKVDAANQDAHLGKGIVLLDRGDLLGATAEFNVIAEAKRSGEFAGADTRLQSAYYYLGVIANRQQQPDQALSQLEKALTINATDSDSIYQVGIAMALQGKHQEALNAFQQALQFVPTDWCEPYQQMKLSYTALNQPEKASYAAAMDAYCGGRKAEGKQQLTALVDGPAGVESMLGLGLIAQVDKDTDGAAAWYRKALERDPKNIQAITQLAGLGVAPDAAATPAPKK